jgi:hypothetical protein
METKDVIILAACLAMAGFSLYRKYMKKEQQKTGSQQNYKSTLTGKDDYEPYSGK